MKINTLSSTHKKYIKKYGAVKAAEKYNLNLTKAKSYESKFKSESYRGKRTLNKKSMDDDSSIFDDEPMVQEEPEQYNGTNSIGSALGYNPAEMNQMNMGMGQMPGMPQPSMAMSPQMQGMGMPQPSMAMSPQMNDGSMTFDPMQGMGQMPPMGMPGMGQMPPMGMQGMPPMGMPGMFQGQGQQIDMNNIDPLMVEVSAPVNQFNGNMQQIQSLPMHQNNLSQLAGGGNKVDLMKLAYF